MRFARVLYDRCRHFHFENYDRVFFSVTHHICISFVVMAEDKVISW